MAQNSQSRGDFNDVGTIKMHLMSKKPQDFEFVFSYSLYSFFLSFLQNVYLFSGNVKLNLTMTI